MPKRLMHPIDLHKYYRPRLCHPITIDGVWHPLGDTGWLLEVISRTSCPSVSGFKFIFAFVFGSCPVKSTSKSQGAQHVPRGVQVPPIARQVLMRLRNRVKDAPQLPRDPDASPELGPSSLNTGTILLLFCYHLDYALSDQSSNRVSGTKSARLSTSSGVRT